MNILESADRVNRKMKAFLEDKGLNPSNYLVERKTSKEVGFINKETKQVIYFECDWGKV